MKLSMWMIANRLSSLDMETEIEEDAPVILNSARRAYATNCVHVYREKDCVVCNGEGNIIRFKNMEVTQAFEIIQAVFDFYEDWLDALLVLVREKKYQEMINQAWMVFHNPLVLFDGNNKVLGISEQYDADFLDAEWKYLCQFGYSSLNAIHYMRSNYSDLNFEQHGSKAYNFSGNNQLAYGGITYCMYCNEVICGRVNLLESERKLNTGDFQLLEKLCTILEPSMGQQLYETFFSNSNVFYNILFGKAYDEKKLLMQLSYQEWGLDDIYQLALIQVLDGNSPKSSSNYINMLLQTIQQQQPHCVVMRKSPFIMILSNRLISEDSSMMHFLDALAKSNSLQIGFSLPCRGLMQASYLYEQGKATLKYGIRRKPGEVFYHFFDYAIDYIIETVPLIRCIQACHPAVYDMWNAKESKNDEMFDTLKKYLDNERSVAKTAAEMYIHRNTIIYRVKKIQEFLNDDLKDAYARDYIRLSIRVLELHGQQS